MSTRRTVLKSGLCLCAAQALLPRALATLLPLEYVPMVTPGYQPKDVDEQGMWGSMERLEEAIAGSSLRLKDDSIQGYVNSLCSNLLGRYSYGLRVYVVRTPDFNAAMFPNGMMIVNSGLLARVRNEAQLASVLGHECGHYLLQHSVQRWRDLRRKSAISAWVSMGGMFAGAATGNTNWYSLASSVDTALLMSVLSYSRAQETEADGFGLKLIADSGYPATAASEVWMQLIEERKASAKARKKRNSNSDGGPTHPPTDERMRDLKETATHMQRISVDSQSQDDGRGRWKAATQSSRLLLLDEQVKQNDPGASLYLVNSLAADGWDGVLRYCEGETYRLRGEDGDASLAAQSYAAAVQFPDAPAAAYRGHGYALIRKGNSPEGHQALARYLELDPKASDAEIIRATIGPEGLASLAPNSQQTL